MRVLIVGAGIIGLLQARAFAKQGVSVTLLDQSEFAREASWAGGGIISPLYPWRYSDAVTALARSSQKSYLPLVESLHAETGIDPELSAQGMFVLDIDDREKALEWGRNISPDWVQEVSRADVERLAPGIHPCWNGPSLWMPEICSVRNPRLLKALKAWVQQSSLVTCLERTKVSRFRVQSGQVSAVICSDGTTLEADKFVLTTGAWTQGIAPNLHVAPVKGQMILFRGRPGVLSRVVLAHGRYLIPRRDGRIVVGSTLEHVGFNKHCDEQAKESLLQSALGLMPMLSEFEIEHQWAGLRPSSPQGVPYIGLLPEYENVYVNAGHFRNGFVLAPASVNLLRSICLDETPEIDPSPYAPHARISISEDQDAC